MLPAYVPAHNLPPPPSPSTLTVNARGRLYPSKALLRQLGLRAGQPIDLLPPTAKCPAWQLDLRPTAPRRIAWHENTRPRVDGLRLPPGLIHPDRPLTLALAEASSPGLYCLTPLLPVAAPGDDLD
jgi:hypothetical protein